MTTMEDYSEEIVSTETDAMISKSESNLDVLAGIEALSKKRQPTLSVRDSSNKSEKTKYESFDHMSDVVDEVLTRSGTSLHEIRRRGMSETSIESAQRSDIGMLQKVNQYTVTAEIARGSFGVVYLVENQDEGNGSIYAMKTFPQAKVKSKTLRRMPGKAKAEDEITLVRKEIALMKKLIHPNVVRLYEVVEETIYPHSIYMIMEYVGGGVIMSMKEALEPSESGEQQPPQWECVLTGSVMGESLASKLFRQLTSALEFLHHNQVAHRDLKPENILVTIEGDLKVADFGVSQDFSHENAHTSDSSRKLGIVSDTKGSWSYWAPEMIDESRCNAYSAYSADVWAAGVCLWQFVFGSLPFWAPQPGNSPELLFKEILSVKEKPPTLPSRKSPELLELLQAIFTAEPNDRPTFHSCSQYAWLQQYSNEIVEQELNEASARTIDRMGDELDVANAVTPGEINKLTDNTKSHILKMADRVKARVRERRLSIQATKDEEIQTKKEVRRSFDTHQSSEIASQLAQLAAASNDDSNKDHEVKSGSETDISDISFHHTVNDENSCSGISVPSRDGKTPPIPEGYEDEDDAQEAMHCLKKGVSETNRHASELPSAVAAASAEIREAKASSACSFGADGKNRTSCCILL